MKRDQDDDQQDQDTPADMNPNPDDDEVTQALWVRAQMRHAHLVNGTHFYMH
jgi:hypothetical protein